MPYLNGVFYEKKGKGYPLIFLPGLGAHCKELNVFTDKLVKKDFMVLSIDLPGFGRSKKTYWRKVWNKTISNMISHHNLKEYGMIGYSNGGLVCLNYSQSIKNPEHLILISSPSSSFGKIWISTAKMLLSFTKNTHYKKWKWQELAVYRIIKTFTNDVKHDVKKRKIYWAKKNKLKDQVYYMYLAVGFRPNFDKIKTKSLVIYGDKDVLVTEHNSLELARKLKAKGVLFKGQNHSIPYEKPDEVVKVISDFIKK